MASVNDFTGAMLEKVLPTLQEMYAQIPYMAVNVIENDMPVERVSKRDCRLPVEVIPGSDYGVGDLNGGAIGRGSGPVEVVQTISYFVTKEVLEVTFEAQIATKTREQAIVEALDRGLNNALKEAKEQDNIAFHASPDGAAQGLIGFATLQSGGTVYTFADNAAFGVGVNLLRINHPVHVWDVTLATHKTSVANGGPIRVLSVNNNTKQITLASAVVGAANTDVFGFNGLTAVPAHKFGLFYYHNDASTGNLLALSRATYPVLAAKSVDAAGALLLPEHIGLLDDKIELESGTLPGQHEGFLNPCQRGRIKTLQMSIENLPIGATTEIVDMVPRSKDSFTWGGHTWHSDIRMPRTRMDLVMRGNWGRVSPNEGKIDYLRDADGNKAFKVHSTTDGSMLTLDQFVIVKLDNWFCKWAGREGYLKGLGVPAGS